MLKKVFNKTILKKYIFILFLTTLGLVILSLVVIIGKELLRPPSIMGILVVTPGYPQGTWNQPIYDLFSNLNSPYPLRLGLSGFVPEYDINKQLKELAKERISKIRMIPLFVFTYQSHTPELFDLLGIRNKYSKNDKKIAFSDNSNERFSVVRKVFYTFLYHKKIQSKKIKIPIEITSALDFDPLIGDILIDRFKELSSKPEEEVAIYFAYGSVQSEVLEHQKNQEIMNKYSNYLKEKGFNFSESIYLWACHEPDWSQLQKIIEASIAKGRKVNIIPYLLFPKSQIDSTIQQCINLAIINTDANLKDIRYSGKTLYPHPNLIKWIQNQITNPRMLDKEFYEIRE